MKKNSIKYNDEIDLTTLFKIIWDGKIKILLITLISFLVGFGYTAQISNNYLNSLSIYPSNNYKLNKFENIKALIKSNQSDQSILYLFIDELKDYKEFLYYLKGTKTVQENISKLKIEDQEKKMFQYATLLEIVEPSINEENYSIKFKWHDPEEAKKILRDTLKLTSSNLQSDFINELQDALEFEKKKKIK